MPRKKKTEIETEKTAEVTEEKKEISPAVEQKEFPDIEIGIDVFSQAPTEAPKESKEDLEAKRKALSEKLKEKAKKLASQIEEKNVKEEVMESEEKKRAKKNEKTLFPLDDYVKYSSHLGTKAITPHMRQFVYKRRADGLAVLNTNSIDEKLKVAIEFMKNYAPDTIFLACKREAGWKAAKKFSEVTGIRVFTKKYPAGIITNIKLADFFENDLTIICDPWLDKNALNDSIRVRKPVISLCDTNNLTSGVDRVIPCNNKSAKSLGLILYLLAREYLKATGKEKEASELKLEDFAGPLEEREERPQRAESVKSEDKTEEKAEKPKEEKQAEVSEPAEKGGAKEGV
jgi:small subunit ribosomal protein S2